MDNKYINAIESVKQIYRRDYAVHQYSLKSLGIYSDRQNIRFDMLTQHFDLENSSILDIGCGFGDFNQYLKKIGVASYIYLGIDMMNEFIDEGVRRYGTEQIEFLKGDFLLTDFQRTFDFVITSQTLNNRLYPDLDNNYDFLFALIRKGFNLCNKGIAFNFFNDKGDYKNNNTAYHDPAKILDFCYTLSKNIVFCNHYAPYECTMILFKEDHFKQEMMLFDTFVEENKVLFDEKFYVVTNKRGQKD